MKSVALFAIVCMIGSALGTRLTLYLSDRYLKYILVCILPILIFVLIIKGNVKNLLNDNKIEESLSKIKLLIFSILFSGKIMFEIAIPAAICSMLGNYIGAGLAIKKENKIMKPLFIIIFIGLFIKLIFDLIITQ